MRKLLFFRKVRKLNKNYSNVHECFAFILMLGKYFAIFPVEDLNSADYTTLKFKWISWSTAYTFIYLISLLVTMGFQIYSFLHVDHIKFGYFVTFLFFACSFATTLLFVRLARNWPKLVQKWVEIDDRMICYKFDKKLAVRLKIIATVVLLAALKHTLYLATAITSTPEFVGWRQFELFLRNNFFFVFNYVRFAIWKAALLLVVNIMSTFTWNYMDLYIMLISASLTSKFKQISLRLKTALLNKPVDVTYWKMLRNDYNAVADLCRWIDNAVSDIILLSFANNLFVILVQLFNSLRPRDDSIVGRIYFIYSFGFLMIRTVAVSLYAAGVNEASKEPTPLLLSVSPEIYNVEIERFIYKIQADPCALTGKKFFNVTKSLILNIAGAIVTYELVLIQFQVVT